MAEEDNLRLMRELIDAFNAHDLDRIAERVDEAYIGETDTLPAPLQGREEYRRMLKMYYSAFPDAHYEVEQMIASGDYVFTRLHITGTHRGEFLGKAPTNRRFDIHLCHVDQFKDGKVIRAWYYWDTATMLRQLGMGQGEGIRVQRAATINRRRDSSRAWKPEKPTVRKGAHRGYRIWKETSHVAIR